MTGRDDHKVETEAPNTQDAPTAPDDPIVGIDLGTTNSLVARVDASGPRLLRGSAASSLVPSVVSIDGDRFLVGQVARDRALDHPETTLYSIKRLMGRSVADLSEQETATLPFTVVEGERGLARVRVGERDLAPEEVSALVLRELKERASQELGLEVRRAVITVPAYFDDAQRQATRVAGQLAGLEVVRIVNEPTAAALAYGLDRTRSGAVVVYDLGGGTFDVSVLEIREGLFRVRATAGDTQLGGDDFDRHLMQRLLALLPAGETADARLLQAVKQAAEAAKIQLTTHDQVEYSVVDDRTGRELSGHVTRDEFERLIADEVQRTLDCCRKALDDAELSAGDLNAVVLVGGSTRVPLVRQRVEEFFGRRPYTGVNPDEVVALGAAVQANILSGDSRELLLLDVIPLSLGIETYGGAVAKIILRNSPIPAQASDTFTTYVDNQTAIDVHVLQGERELVQDCRSLGRFRLAGLPPMPAGMARVDVTFLVDENGVLTVNARERASGAEAAIEVVPSYGLTDEEVARIVQESFQFAREDFAAHQLIDLRNECRTMIAAVGKILSAGAHGLGDEEVAGIRAMASEVEGQLGTQDVKALKALYDRFVESTVPLAGEVMSEVAQEFVQGRTIDEVLAEKKPQASAASASAPRTSASPAPTVRKVLTASGGGGDTRPDGKDCGDLGEGFRAAPAAGGDAMKLTWKDSEEIGIQLYEKFGDVDPLTVRFTDLHRYVTELPDFDDDPKGSSEGILEAIQMAWYDEYND